MLLLLTLALVNFALMWLAIQGNVVGFTGSSDTDIDMASNQNSVFGSHWLFCCCWLTLALATLALVWIAIEKVLLAYICSGEILLVCCDQNAVAD